MKKIVFVLISSILASCVTSQQQTPSQRLASNLERMGIPSVEPLEMTEDEMKLQETIMFIARMNTAALLKENSKVAEWADDGDTHYHPLSGARCPKQLETLSLLRVVELPSKMKGGDMLCFYTGDGGKKLSFYVTHLDTLSNYYNPSAIIAKSRMVSQMMGGGRTTVAPPLLQSDGAAFEATTDSYFSNNSHMISSTVVDEVKHWILKIRVDYSKEQTSDIALAVEKLWKINLQSIPNGKLAQKTFKDPEKQKVDVSN